MRPGYKQTEVGVIPEDWEVKRIKDLTFDISDGNYSSKYPRSSEFKVSGVPFIRANNIRDMQIVDNDMRYISEEKHGELLKGHLKENDVLITTRGEIGQVALVPDRHIGSNINAQLVRINTTGTEVNHKYFAYFLQKQDTQERILSMQTGSALKQLPVFKLVTLNVAIPSLKEQRAIAATLNDVDGLLAGLDRLIAKKRAVKTAVMQQLLTGEVRVGEGNENGRWSTRKLGEIADLIKGSGLSKSALTNSGQNQCILYGELFTTYERIIDRVISATNSDEGVSSKSGDVLMPGSTTTTGEDLATASALLVDNVKLGGDINIIRQKAKTYDPVFLAYCLTVVCKKAITELAQGITIIHLYGRNLAGLELKMPAIEEQNAIAAILSDIDAEIAALETRRAKTAAIKQGMMQELLTGRTRLL